MKLSPAQIGKIDGMLKDALVKARPDQDLTAVMVLDACESIRIPRNEPDPKSFSSVADYRRALIAQQQFVGASCAPALEALSRLSLAVVGDEAGPVVVVSGAAKQITKALELSEVRSAALDRDLHLVR